MVFFVDTQVPGERILDTEKRASIRKRISLNVLINHDLTYSKRWKICDLSLNGALLEMSNKEFLPGTPIEAVILLKEHGQSDLYRLPAEVVRLNSEGLALRFGNYDNNTYTALVNLLYSS
jgi:hypothetical protein